MSTGLDASQSLKRIESWVSRVQPDRLPFLRPAASTDTVQRIEVKLGLQLPLDIRMLCAVHDGQPEGATALYLNQRWLTLDLVAVAWEDLCLRHDFRADIGVATKAIARPPLAATTWSGSWLPLFGSPRGDHYCIDLRSDRPGRCGQMIWFLYDRPGRTVIAQNFSHLLGWVAGGLAAGEWHLDAGYDGLSD